LYAGNSIALKAVIKRMRGMKDLHGDELEVVADLREKMQTEFDLIKYYSLYAGICTTLASAPRVSPSSRT
jgi:hypothetical protein